VPQAEGDYPAARDCYEQSVEVHCWSLGDDHHETGESRNNPGYLLLCCGEWAEARPHLEVALAAVRRAFGDETPEQIVILGNLAGLHVALGEPEAAWLRLQEIAALDGQLLGQLLPLTQNRRDLNHEVDRAASSRAKRGGWEGIRQHRKGSIFPSTVTRGIGGFPRGGTALHPIVEAHPIAALARRFGDQKYQIPTDSGER
jgi:hypothetical protein